MCDYSLHAVAARPARVGDRLRTTQFRNSITHGLAAVCDPDVAVCLLPGTEVAFDEEPRYASPLGFWTRKAREKVARFRHVNPHNPNTHHDAVEFPSGQIILINRLLESQTLTVLQLPVEMHKAAGAAKAITTPV